MKNTICYFDLHAMIAMKNLYLAVQIKEKKYKAYGNSLKLKKIILNYIPFWQWPIYFLKILSS
jgi:hypothetical protein